MSAFRSDDFAEVSPEVTGPTRKISLAVVTNIDNKRRVVVYPSWSDLRQERARSRRMLLTVVLTSVIVAATVLVAVFVGGVL